MLIAASLAPDLSLNLAIESWRVVDFGWWMVAPLKNLPDNVKPWCCYRARRIYIDLSSIIAELLVIIDKKLDIFSNYSLKNRLDLVKGLQFACSI
jgi:hypothetical protein